MTKDSPSSSGGAGPPSPRAPRPSPRRAPCQHPGGGSGAGCGAPPSPFHEDHRRELEALRAELEAERLRAQEARRRFAVEARELRVAAERERQLLADQLRSKWEQQRARELHQLREATQRQREAEIRQLLRWKEAELREAQELLQRERDAAMRQARDLQRQLAEELVSRGGGGSRGGGAGLSAECRAKLQEVLGKLRWEVDGEQAARIRHLKAELELERSLFLKYILERFEGESLRAGSPHRCRQASSQQQQQQRLGRTRPRSLESLLAACAPDVRALSNQSCSPTRGDSPCCPQLLEEGSPARGNCPEQPHEKAPGPASPLKEEPQQEACADAPPEGKVSSWGAAGERTPEALQGQGWLSGHSYNQLTKQNTELLNALNDLEQRCTHLKEENTLLRRSSFPEMQDKVKRLKGKKAELAVIAKRLEERAKKLQESPLRISSAPVPSALNCSGVELCKDVFAQQQAKDLKEQASVLLAKDQQVEALQRECQELQAKLSAGKENTYLLNISDFDRLLRESQREVLRLQRQITLKTLKESLETTKTGSNGSSSSVSKQEGSSTINIHLEDSSLAKKTPKTLNILKKDAESEALPLGNEAKNGKNNTLKTDLSSENHLKLLENQLVEKLKQCENLRHEVEEKQKRCDEVQLKLKEVLSENVKISKENSQLHGKNKWAEKIENENADLKVKLVQASDERESAVQLTKRLEVKVESLEGVVKSMKEIAERWQQLETEHKKTLLELQKKEKEIQQLQQVQTEIKREHEEAVQLLEAQVKELENQYHSQTEHFNLLTQELERFRIKESGLLGLELPHTACSSSEMDCPEKWEQDTYRALHCNSNISDEDDASVASADLIKKVKELESCSNSSELESMQNSSKSCLNPEEDTLGEMEELETDKVSLNLQSENQHPSKLRVFLARFSYDPFNGPNKNPEVELPLTAGEYVYIYGETDEDGFYEGELMDGRRGLVPSNLVEEAPGNDLISFIPSEPSDISYNSFHESSFPCQSASSGGKSPDEDMCVCHLPNRPEGGLYEVQTAVPYPQNLTLIKQSEKAIIIGWDPPQMLDSWEEIHSYNIYVNTELHQIVKSGSQMKTVIDSLDLELQTYRISVQSVTDKGNSDRMQCTFLVGNTFHIAPTALNLRNLTATSAEITWLPSNSNYSHTVHLNEKEYDLTKAGIYCYTFQNLRPSTQYSVQVEPLMLNEALTYPQAELELKSTAVTFTTPSAGPPDAPLAVQVQLDFSADILVISWLPVTIDPAGSSNGAKVIGYAVYINGQKVTEIMSPTAGNVSLEVSQICMFQGPWKVSVRTISLFGYSEDSVPALIPSTLQKVPSALLSKFVASGLTFKEFLESEGMSIPATTCTSSPSSSHMCVPNTDTNFTIHFTTNYEDSVVPMPLNNMSQNNMSSSHSRSMTTSHIIKNENNSDSMLQMSVGKQTLQQSFPPLCCETSANSTPTVLQAFTEDTDRKRSGKCLSKNMIVKSKPDDGKVCVMTAKDSSDESFLNNSDANCLSPGPSLYSIEFELKKDKDVASHNTCLQEAPAIFHEKDQMKQIKQLCRKLSKLTVSKVEAQEDKTLRIGSWQISLAEYSHNSDLSDIEEEEEEDQATKLTFSGEDIYKPQEKQESSTELAKYKDMTLRADQTMKHSVSDFGLQRSVASGDSVNDDSARLFVALFDYDPITMSPDVDKEQLPLKNGQVLKVIGDKDADGFYRGECEGKKGFIPCSMVSEMLIDSTEVKDQLLKKAYEG